jgi:hypothetical protein
VELLKEMELVIYIGRCRFLEKETKIDSYFFLNTIPSLLKLWFFDLLLLSQNFFFLISEGIFISKV